MYLPESRGQPHVSRRASFLRLFRPQILELLLMYHFSRFFTKNNIIAIYTVARKWSKQAKLRNACYTLMSTFICYGNAIFVTAHATDLLNYLLTALKASISL